ncbi:hypothetical protein COOONC_17754 [Cooperia oncophora]
MARGSQRKSSDRDQEKELPLWASMMLEQYSACADRIEKALMSSFTRLIDKACVSRLHTSNSVDPNLLYSTIVKVKADGSKIDDKLRRITWVGIGEQDDELATRKFDMEALKEAVHSSGDEELIKEFSKGTITARSKDRLLRHMRSGRQSLTRRFVHSYARRDYTVEELELDRALRRQAGQSNAGLGKLQYVVRDLQIHKLKTARELPTRSSANTPGALRNSSGTPVGSFNTSMVGTSGNSSLYA